MKWNRQSIDSFLKLSLLILLIAGFVFTTSPTMAQENYCKDPKSWKEWDALVKKYPTDMDIQFLHALRLGLCAKIERGDLTLNQAIEIFDRYHGAVIKNKNGEKGVGESKGL